jgi:aminoglycoside phosphotransferase (APT) family kinase protein
VLFEASDGERRLALCATIIANPEMLVIPNQDVLRNDVDVEAQVRTVALAAGVPVPRVHAICLDSSYVGGPFFISEQVSGETVPRRVLRLVEQHHLGDRVAAELGSGLARLHAVPPEKAPSGLISAATLNPAERAVEVADGELTNLLAPRPVLAFGLRWLERHLPPPPERRTIVHTDARNGNLIVGPGGLRAILDWERAARDDDPMRDLAWPALRMWRFGNDEREIGGFASRGAFVDGYTAAGGDYDAERFEWWKVMCTVSWALGLAGQAKQFLDGTMPSLVMAGSGRRVSELEWDVLMLLNRHDAGLRAVTE